jgi:transketolase
LIHCGQQWPLSSPFWEISMQQQLRELCVSTIRLLSADMVERANSGHPGAPMGLADAAFVLWTEFLRYNPDDPEWVNRDRFVLSVGHASALLYSMLHLSGYDLPLEELQRFRQLQSQTPGHPEFRVTPGVECTTGPLGAGFGNGVGMALAAKMHAARFNDEQHPLINPSIYVMCSDGDMQEGVSSEAASLAGHLGLGNLIAIYDSNQITIAGEARLAMSENVGKRFEAYGWHVQECDGHDHAQISQSIQSAQNVTNQPSLIIARTTIGKGAPNKQGSSGVHGAPLGADELQATRAALNWGDHENFYVPQEVYEVFEQRKAVNLDAYEAWQASFTAWQTANAEKATAWSQQWEPRWSDTELLEQFIPVVQDSVDATRSLSGKVMQKAAELLPAFVGGSADLEPSTKTLLKEFSSVTPATLESNDLPDPSFRGRNIHFGIREHAMGSIVNGLALFGGFRPFGSTFLVFSDYMRPSIRLAALSGLPSVFVFTHDSYAVGEDGPTHQPIEHAWALRLIPELEVWRPADALETAAAWASCLGKDHELTPTALLLTRQKTEPLVRREEFEAQELLQGAYIVQDFDYQSTRGREYQLSDSSIPGIVILSTGSEGGAAQQVRHMLQAVGIPIRHVSAPCIEMIDYEDGDFQEYLFPQGALVVSVEAGVEGPWRKYADYLLGYSDFGASAPHSDLQREFGFEPEQLRDTLLEWLKEDGIIE